MFNFIRGVLGLAPWVKDFQCDREIEFDYVNRSHEPAHHQVAVKSLRESLMGQASIRAAFLDGGDDEYTFILNRMSNVRDLKSGHKVPGSHLSDWLEIIDRSNLNKPGMFFNPLHAGADNTQLTLDDLLPAREHIKSRAMLLLDLRYGRYGPSNFFQNIERFELNSLRNGSRS